MYRTWPRPRNFTVNSLGSRSRLAVRNKFRSTLERLRSGSTRTREIGRLFHLLASRITRKLDDCSKPRRVRRYRREGRPILKTRLALLSTSSRSDDSFAGTGDRCSPTTTGIGNNKPPTFNNMEDKGEL